MGTCPYRNGVSYEVLSDDAKRREYDLQLSPRP